MKNGKRLTAAQKELLAANGYDPEKYLRVKDLPTMLIVVHRVTGKQEMIMK